MSAAVATPCPFEQLAPAAPIILPEEEQPSCEETKVARKIASLGSLLQNIPIANYNPEDSSFWEAKGQHVASRALFASCFSLFLSFATWQILAPLIPYMDTMGFTYTVDQRFMLAALPALSGAVLRVFYSFTCSLVSGRLWLTLSTLSLLAPLVLLCSAISNPATPYYYMVAIALLLGLGAANFSSNMANLVHYYPGNLKGSALGINAGLGNLGVSFSQMLVPLAITLPILSGLPLAGLYPQSAVMILIPCVLVSSLVCWIMVDDVPQARCKPQISIVFNKNIWYICFAYVACFGTFLGLASSFPILCRQFFPAIVAAKYAWIGPLVGALIRPVGGSLSDQYGPARVSLVNFLVMMFFSVLMMTMLPKTAALSLPIGPAEGNFYGFYLLGLIPLMLCSGIGNGSCTAFCPIVFFKDAIGDLKEDDVENKEQYEQQAAKGRKEGAAAVGFSGAIAAVGGFIIPKAYGTSINLTGGINGAILFFMVYYVSSSALVWYSYIRDGAKIKC